MRHVVQRVNVETLEVEWLVSLFVAEDRDGETMRSEVWTKDAVEAMEFASSDAEVAAKVARGFVATRPEPVVSPCEAFAMLEERGLA